WEYFWEDKSRLYPEFAEMSESSTYKIAQVAFKVMTDGGFLESTKTKILTNIYITPDVRTLLIDMNKEDIIQAMEAY
ncbi:BrxA family protein, partial [Aliivibrio finisterrensis]